MRPTDKRSGRINAGNAAQLTVVDTQHEILSAELKPQDIRDQSCFLLHSIKSAILFEPTGNVSRTESGL